jgi:hypothetical protein
VDLVVQNVKKMNGCVEMVNNVLKPLIYVMDGNYIFLKVLTVQIAKINLMKILTSVVKVIKENILLMFVQDVKQTNGCVLIKNNVLINHKDAQVLLIYSLLEVQMLHIAEMVQMKI